MNTEESNENGMTNVWEMGSKWPEVRLGDLGEVGRGRSRHRPRHAPELYGGPYPFIQTGDIKVSGGRITTYVQTYSEYGLSQSRLWPAGTMAITIAANIAETAILTFPACFPDSVVGFVPDESKCDVRFVEYNFRILRNKIQHENVGTGSVQDNINLQTLDELRFPLPSLPEQRAIAHILGTLDDKIELNRRMNQTLEKMARAIFQDWFVDFGPVRAKLGGCEPYLPPGLWDLFPDRLVESELGEIPEGWEAKALGTVATTVKGRSYRSSQLTDSDTALVTLKSFGRGGGYQPEGLKAYVGDCKPEQVLAPGEVIIACTDVAQAGQVIGHAALVEPSPKYRRLVASLDIYIVRPVSKEIGREFLYFVCGTAAFISHASAYSTGTTVLHLSKDAIPSFETILPPAELLRAFGLLARPFLEERMKSRLIEENLAAQRDALLPKLVSGEVKLGTDRIWSEEVDEVDYD